MFAALLTKAFWSMLWGRVATNAKADFAAIPPKAKMVLAGIAALLVLTMVHQHIAHKAVADAYAKGKADEAAHVEAKAKEIKEKVDTLTTKIAQSIGSRTDAEIIRIHDSANSVRMLAPGRAACTSVAGVPAAASGPQSPGGQAGAPVGRVPYPEWQSLLAMPSAPTITFAEQHDLNRAEIIAWREWYLREREAFKPAPPANPKKRGFFKRLVGSK